MVGTDIIEVSRIEKLIKDKGDRFLNRIYTQKEIDYCESKGLNKFQHYAGRFAAKESIIKVLDSFIESDRFTCFSGELIFTQVEILNNNKGVPKVNLLSNKSLKIGHAININVSISHIKEYAMAVAIIET